MAFGESFLAQPDLFPARQTGEPWGPERVLIHFAGNDYSCTGLSAIQAAAVRQRFGKLCEPITEASRPGVEIRVFQAAPVDFFGDEDDWEYDFDLDYAPNAVTFAGFHFMGRLDWSPKLQAAVWTSEDSLMVVNAIFENVLRVVVAYHLLEQGGILLHSAAVANAAGAHIFFGPSGAGKSTISRLSAANGFGVLSDDMNALRITGGDVVVEKLPFAGDFGQTGDTAEGFFPVKTLSMLEKGAVPALRSLAPASAVSALIGCASFVNRNPYRFDELVAKLQALNGRLPVRVLTFSPDNRYLELLASS